MGQDEQLPVPNVESFDLTLSLETSSQPIFERATQVGVRPSRLLTETPWVRSFGRLGMNVSTEGWRFPTPLQEVKETRRQEDKEKAKARGPGGTPSPCLLVSPS